ncbi:prepilin-type N-terminal cleavage/methylation domain-containing protein [Glaciecola siphonariae]|uniref:Prepilin-type N-terminal cleavage/methylation domain-containing protein n=1 Tax=Glaciecola siphonariae TaxID=521012 RepID=A0ABV9LU70_9ALTE
MNVAICARFTRGFSLVELLVVLVIVSATTTLLISGFSITWKNFSKLSQRDLVMNSHAVGERWLRESLADAVLFHPNDSQFYGNANSIQFVSLAAPWQSASIPTPMTWQIIARERTAQLSLQSPWIASPLNDLANLPVNTRFEYLRNGQWVSEFTSNDAELPSAVRLSSNGEILSYIVLKRPGKAKVPPEMLEFGQYEFNG